MKTFYNNNGITIYHGDCREVLDALVVDPYMGSGPVARACQDFGMRYIGVELSEAYCELAVRHLAQEVESHA